MRRPGFIRDLYQEKKIQVVSPSTAVKDAYLHKAERYLLSARLLQENEHYEEAVSMAYYSMYYGVIALFFQVGLKCENHTAAIILLGEVFDLDATALANAKRERIDTQYYVDTQTTAEDVREMIRDAEVFNTRINDFIARMTNQEIRKYREVLKTIVE